MYPESSSCRLKKAVWCHIDQGVDTQRLESFVKAKAKTKSHKFGNAHTFLMDGKSYHDIIINLSAPELNVLDANDLRHFKADAIYDDVNDLRESPKNHSAVEAKHSHSYCRNHLITFMTDFIKKTNAKPTFETPFNCFAISVTVNNVHGREEAKVSAFAACETRVFRRLRMRYFESRIHDDA